MQKQITNKQLILSSLKISRHTLNFSVQQTENIGEWQCSDI